MTVFNAVCFCVLMDHHHDGIEQAHPSYLEEKLAVFENCSENVAFSMLDEQNQHRVLQWCSNWEVTSPVSR